MYNILNGEKYAAHRENVLMIPTLVAGIIGLIIVVRARLKPEPLPVRVRVDGRYPRVRRRV